MSPFTLIVTAASGPSVPLAIRMLKQSGRHHLRVIAVDMAPKGASAHFADEFLPVPPGDDPGYVDAIAQIAARFEADLILPWSDEEALALATARERIEVGSTRLACAPADLLKDMSDKVSAARRLSELDLPTGIWREATGRDAIEDGVKAIVEETGEAALKPARSRGGRNIFVIRCDLKGVHSVNYGRETHLDLDSFLKHHLDAAAALAPVIIMERLLAPVYDIDILAWEGEAHRVVPRRRLNAGGVPFEGNIIVPDPELIALGHRAASAVGLSWLYDLDVMTDRSGLPVIMELNPRPSGSMPASIAVGVPLLDDLVSLAKGEALPDLPEVQSLTVLPYLEFSVSNGDGVS